MRVAGDETEVPPLDCGRLHPPADQHRLCGGAALADHLLHGQRAAPSCPGRGAHGCTVLFLLREFPRGGGLLSRGRRLSACTSPCVGNTTPHRWALSAHIVAAAIGLAALIPFAATADAAVPESISDFARAAGVVPAIQHDLADRYFPIRTRQSQYPDRSHFHGRRRRRAEIAVLPVVGADQHGRHHPVQLLHGFRSAAASATRTSTSSGKARRTTSRRSTTSSTGSRSSTCRIVVGTRPSKWCAGCHDHAVFFNGRFDRPIKEQIDTPEAPRGPGAARRATPSCTWTAPWATAISRSSTRRCTTWPPASNPYIHALDYFLTYLNPEPHQQTFLKPFMRGESAEFCSAVPQGAPGRAGEPTTAGSAASTSTTTGRRAAFRARARGRSTIRPKSRSARTATCRWCLRTIRATATARCTRTASRRPIRRVAYVNQDEAQLEATREVSEVRLHHGGHLRGLAGRDDGRARSHGAPRRRRGRRP